MEIGKYYVITDDEREDENSLTWFGPFDSRESALLFKRKFAKDKIYSYISIVKVLN